MDIVVTLKTPFTSDFIKRKTAIVERVVNNNITKTISEGIMV